LCKHEMDGKCGTKTNWDVHNRKKRVDKENRTFSSLVGTLVKNTEVGKCS
jgi:hypothetical protein